MGDNKSRELLNSMQYEAEKKDREFMNMKMEIAHLRERLSMRVGGDTNAIELEAENFTLKKSLTSAQETTTQHLAALREMTRKHEKAIENLVKLDRAWKTTLEKLQIVQEDMEKRDIQIVELEERLNITNYEHEQVVQTLQSTAIHHEEEHSRLQTEKENILVQLTSLEEIITKQNLEIKTLQGQLDEVKNYSSTQSKASRADVEVLEQRFLRTKEACAVLRGETNALREETKLLQSQLSECRKQLTDSTHRYLQLKEEHSTLQIHFNSMKIQLSQKEKEIVDYRQEIEKLTEDCATRDQKLIALEEQRYALELEVRKTQQAMTLALQTGDSEAKRAGKLKEQEYRDKEYELLEKIQILEAEKDRIANELQSIKQVHNSVFECVLPDGENHHDDYSRWDLKSVIIDEINEKNQLKLMSEHQRKRIEVLENEVSNTDTLREENEKLKEEVIKVKNAMGRIAARRQKRKNNSMSLHAINAKSNNKSSTVYNETLSRRSYLAGNRENSSKKIESSNSKMYPIQKTNQDSKSKVSIDIGISQKIVEKKLIPKARSNNDTAPVSTEDQKENEIIKQNSPFAVRQPIHTLQSDHLPQAVHKKSEQSSKASPPLKTSSTSAWAKSPVLLQIKSSSSPSRKRKQPDEPFASEMNEKKLDKNKLYNKSPLLLQKTPQNPSVSDHILQTVPLDDTNPKSSSKVPTEISPPDQSTLVHTIKDTCINKKLLAVANEQSLSTAPIPEKQVESKDKLVNVTSHRKAKRLFIPSRYKMMF